MKARRVVPVAVGFGVGTPQQAAEVGEIADGVIVGSRLVRALGDAPDPAAGRGRRRPAGRRDGVGAPPACNLPADGDLHLQQHSACATFVVTWALGLSADVGALIAVCFVLIGILIHKAIPAIGAPDGLAEEHLGRFVEVRVEQLGLAHGVGDLHAHDLGSL